MLRQLIQDYNFEDHWPEKLVKQITLFGCNGSPFLQGQSEEGDVKGARLDQTGKRNAGTVWCH